MAIMSRSEFEAVIGNVINRIEKELVARGSIPAIETARDELAKLRASAGDSKKLKALRGKLEQATDAVTGVISEQPVLDQLWDLLDYIDYRA